MEPLTLFGAGLIVGGVGLLAYAYRGARGGRSDPPRKRRGLPLIRRSTLLDETVPIGEPPAEGGGEGRAALSSWGPRRTPT